MADQPNAGLLRLLVAPLRAWWTWAGQRQTDRTRAAAIFLPPILAVVLGVVVVTLINAAVSDDSDGQSTRSNSSSVLEQSEMVFQGSYSKEEIKSVLDRAMTLYGLQTTEQNYDRATNALVALRQEFGVKEMDILDYMIRSHVPGIDISFAEAAGLATAFLATGADY